MAFQISLNFFLAFTWMFLKNSYDPITFFYGFLTGLIIIFVFRRFFSARFYLKPVFAIIHLLLVFIKEVILSNVAILKIVLKPKFDMKPGIFALPIEVTKEWEILVLSSMITLTPGTLVIKVSDDNKILYIHAMDIPDVEESINDIKNSFERLIKEVSR
ncbi:Na+/H+ antiporter subunit E [Bacillus sp. V3B]|uniref:Na+/H+ antiporter subunit E n=1 Tax=Bacillus sp. V3B TaxID=2804915 RepID=UPI0021088917|nr:Na+/H+ antiporter subunit E [Bacillus sp. V3B]MCQ6276520.1 Na+/H+ antiporter subunit E [Bacillus sp. V3B]